jgi:hypothetical protein
MTFVSLRSTRAIEGRTTLEQAISRSFVAVFADMSYGFICSPTQTSQTCNVAMMHMSMQPIRA